MEINLQAWSGHQVDQGGELLPYFAKSYVTCALDGLAVTIGGREGVMGLGVLISQVILHWSVSSERNFHFSLDVALVSRYMRAFLNGIS